MITNQDRKAFDKEYAYRTLELINQWINNVDTKASFGLAFATAIMGLLFYNAGKTPAAFTKTMGEFTAGSVSFTTGFSAMVVLVTFILLFVAIAMFFSALRGRVKNASGKQSLLFFGSVSKMSLNDYRSKIFSMTEKNLERDLVEQIHTNSQICDCKFQAYNRGMRFLIFAILATGICSVSGWI